MISLSSGAVAIIVIRTHTVCVSRRFWFNKRCGYARNLSVEKHSDGRLASR